MRVFYVSLKVGQREFIGEGPTRQDARHDAAKKALHILRKLPVPNDGEKKIESPAESEGTSSKDSILMGRHWEYTFKLVQIQILLSCIVDWSLIVKINTHAYFEIIIKSWGWVL